MSVTMVVFSPRLWGDAQTCQSLWELAEHMPLDKLQELLTNVYILWGALASRIVTLQVHICRHH
jgi:hypothetical protein